MIFKEAKSPHSTTKRVIKQFRDSGSTERKQGSGHKVGSGDKIREKKIIAALKRNPELSLRDLGRKYKTDHKNVFKIKRKYGYKSHKKVKVPNRNTFKDNMSILRARRMVKQHFNNFSACILMDDESYVKADFNQLPGQQFYSQIKGCDVHKKFKTIKLDKFAKKFMIWQAICSCGLRSTSFVTSGTMNADVYIKECLNKRMLPMYRQHNIPLLFWPDLASCHYASKTTEWYESNGVSFVSKTANPPNVPELRPIETYWALTKRICKKIGSIACDIKSFRDKWNRASKKVTQSTVLMAGLKSKIRIYSHRKLEEN